MRGKGKRGFFNGIKLRITPACAGKSAFVLPSIVFRRDHPRVCGEKNTIMAMHREKIGSPPRVRGKAAAVIVGTSSTRITPACAGKSSLNIAFSTLIKDHPRVCGEKKKASCENIKAKGSPPRVRGKVVEIF